MASNQVTGLPAKPSFAKVAAMAPPNSAKPPQKIQQPVVAPSSATQRSIGISQAKPTVLPKLEPVVLNNDALVAHTSKKLEAVTESIEGLSLINKISHQKASKGRDQEGRHTESTGDDESHLSNSSSKPPSLGNKSMASVTTFAMDEKESLRPDDSASVQAAEEEESLSSHVTGNDASQIGSDTGLISLRKQPRDVHNGMILPVRRFQLANPPRFGDMPPEMSSIRTENGKHEQSTVSDIVMIPSDAPSIAAAPDEKLLEAMGTPKDRLLLLQMEQKILTFITQTKDEFYDLPPQNSFGRLLAHKLADYYKLAHYITSDNSAVRLYRTQCSRLPVPLGVLATNLAGNGPPPTAPSAVKIMRRTLALGKASAGAGTAASSSVPSKATSDAEADATSDEGIMSPAETTPAKDKSNMTREQREAYYQAARDRIFKDFPESNISENTSAGDASASMSRSSSSSGKKKTRKQRAPKDDSFEARSQFVPGYPGMTFSATQTPFNPSPSNSYYAQLTGDLSSNLVNGMGYGSYPGQCFPQFETPMNYNSLPSYNMGMAQQYGSNDGWSSPQSPQPGSYFNFGTASQTPTLYSQHSSGMLPQSMNKFQTSASGYNANGQAWTPPTYEPTYQQSTMTPNPSIHWPNYPPPPVVGSPPPYPFGQLPQTYSSTPSQNSQHPIPGSFNRSIFNPQTRSFVPESSSARSRGKPGTHKITNHFPPQTTNINGANVSRAETPKKTSQATIDPLQPPTNTSSLSRSQQDSLQKKWGTPAHLPKKPPPSQVPSTFIMDTASPLPSQQAYQPLNTNVVQGSPLIVSGGGIAFSGA